MPLTDLVWKGRMIVRQDGYVDLPPDRQEVVNMSGPFASKIDGDDRLEFIDKLNDLVPQRTLFDIVKAKLRTGEINTRERNEVVLIDTTHNGDRWVIKGNSNASAGYFYVEARIVSAADELVEWIAAQSKDGITQSYLTATLDELVADHKDEERAAINNAGMQAQIDYLIEQGESPERLRQALTDALKS